MEILPLYKLFTTKEDRLAVYKAMRLGRKPKKSEKCLEKLFEGCRLTPLEATEVRSASTSDPLSELADLTGIDILELKKMHFFELLTSTPEKHDVDPFACQTVEDLDSLGRKIFGSLWDSELENEVISWDVEYSEANKSHLSDYEMKPIPHPCIYPEIFVDVNPGAMALYTFAACIMLGRESSSALSFISDADNLKQYLNGNEETPYIGQYRYAEELFVLTLYYLRAVRLTRDTARFSIPSEARDCCDNIHFMCHEVLKPTVEYNKWELFEDIMLQLLKRGAAEFRNSNNLPFNQFTHSEFDFLMHGVIYPYLTNTWKNLLTDVKFKYAPRTLSWDDNNAYFIVANMTKHPMHLEEERKAFEDRKAAAEAKGEDFDERFDASNFGYSIPFGQSKYALIHAASVDTPEGVDRSTVSSVLAYTGFIRGCVRRDFSLLSTEDIEKWSSDDMVALITQSCYISPLRKDGYRLYFAFRTDDSEATPLEIFVDNEEDFSFVEECAASVGASLDNGKNILRYFESGVAPSFDDLTASDTFTYSTYVLELLKMAFMLTRAGLDSPFMTALSDSDGLHEDHNYWSGRTVINDCMSADESDKTLFTVVNGGTSLRRNIFSAELLWCDTLEGASLFAIFKPLTAGDTQLALVVENGEDGDTACRSAKTRETTALYFIDARFIQCDGVPGRYAWGAALPILVRGDLCKVVRWSEIPTLAPELQPAWDYVNSISSPMLNNYLQALYQRDFGGSGYVS